MSVMSMGEHERSIDEGLSFVAVADDSMVGFAMVVLVALYLALLGAFFDTRALWLAVLALAWFCAGHALAAKQLSAGFAALGARFGCARVETREYIVGYASNQEIAHQITIAHDIAMCGRLGALPPLSALSERPDRFAGDGISSAPRGAHRSARPGAGGAARHAS